MGSDATLAPLVFDAQPAHPTQQRLVAPASTDVADEGVRLIGAPLR